jgi:rhamnosyl/mannosyltransferase
LRVCHLGKYYPPVAGGIETHVQVLARAQSRLNLDVRVVCVNRGTTDGSQGGSARTETVMETDGAVQVTRLGRRGAWGRLDFCSGLTALLRRLPQEGVDLIHLHMPNATMLLALAYIQPALPLVITHHSDIVRQRFLKWALRPFERRIYSRAALLLATSPVYAEQSPVLRHYAAKTRVLPLGLDLPSFLEPSERVAAYSQRLREQYGWPLWLMVGRLVYYKGLEVALEALSHIPGTLLIIGAGPLEYRLRRQAKRLGIAERVVWHGHANAELLAGAYRAATCLWFPSTTRSEGFGLVQVEAMASGCPVINTAIPRSGVAWVSPHHETGITVPVNDPRALARAAWQLLNQPALRRQFSQAARQRACSEFHDTLMAERSLQLYARALGMAARQTELAVSEQS